MRIDPIVALTLMLFSLLVAATSVSVSWGYALGRSALKGVTQPDVRPPTSSVPGTQANQSGTGDAPTDMVFWSEDAIITEAKSYVNQRPSN